MKKTIKSYRFSDYIMAELKELRELYPDWSETEIVERAIDLLNALEACKDVVEVYPVRLMDGRRLFLNIGREWTKGM